MFNIFFVDHIKLMYCKLYISLDFRLLNKSGRYPQK